MADDEGWNVDPFDDFVDSDKDGSVGRFGFDVDSKVTQNVCPLPYCRRRKRWSPSRITSFSSSMPERTC